jgi:hypothetical protein
MEVDMRRSLLLTVSVLGLLICVIGGTGLFAALTDSAHTGTNSVDSAALPSSANLQLASASFDGIDFTCSTFSDHLATGFFALTDVVPNSGYTSAFCLRNVGSAPVTLTAVVDQLVDVDTGCTGDEADYQDLTCGNDQAGELSSVLVTRIAEYSCVGAGSPIASYGSATLANAVTPGPLGGLGAGQTKCYFVDIEYGPSVDVTLRQKAQSDRVTWRYVFTGQA